MSNKPDTSNLLKDAEARTVGYVRAWLENPEFKAALYRSDNIKSIEPYDPARHGGTINELD